MSRIYVKKEKESGKLRMCNGAWSINLARLPKDCDTIQYVTEKYTYTISRDKAFNIGFTRVFGGEPKLVVAERCWTKV